MGLSARVVNLVGLCFLHDANEVGGVTQITVVQLEVGVVDMRVLIDVAHPLGVEAAGPALDALDDVALFQQKLCKIRAILASDIGNEGDFFICHGRFYRCKAAKKSL